MSLFFLCLWAFISVFIFGVFFWTTRALMDQKKTWKAFADKNKLKYVPRGFWRSPVVTGPFGEGQIHITSEQRDSNDIRGRTFVTVIQFDAPTKMPVAGVVGSGDFRDYVRGVVARDQIPLTYEGWTPYTVVAKSDHAELLVDYFTADRMRVLDGLIKQKSLSVLFMFDVDEMFLRLETVDPMINLDRLNKMVEKIQPMIKALQAS